MKKELVLEKNFSKIPKTYFLRIEFLTLKLTYGGNSATGHRDMRYEDSQEIHRSKTNRSVRASRDDQTRDDVTNFKTTHRPFPLPVAVNSN